MSRLITFLAVSLATILACSQSTYAQTMHAVLIVDQSPAAGWGKFAPNLALDLTNMVASLLNNVPESHLNFRSITWEEDQDSAPDSVRMILQELQPSPRDSILFYYSGHGGSDDQGQYLALAKGKLYRSELRTALESKGARFVALITDCCNSRSDGFAMFAPAPDIQEPRQVTPAFQSLFFDLQGIVDINSSAPGESAFFTPFHEEPGEDLPGSLFTKALTAFFRKAKSKRVTWDQLVHDVTIQVHVSFREYYPQGAQVAKGSLRQTDQTVYPIVYPGMPEKQGPRTGMLVRDYAGQGALITRVEPHSPAAQVYDLQAKRYVSLTLNQVIIEANNVPITSATELMEVCRKSPQIMRFKALTADQGAREYLMRLRY